MNHTSIRRLDPLGAPEKAGWSGRQHGGQDGLFVAAEPRSPQEVASFSIKLQAKGMTGGRAMATRFHPLLTRGQVKGFGLGG